MMQIFWKYVYGCFKCSFIPPQIANHPLLIRRVYNDKDIDRIARLLYPKGAFGFECSLERAIQELKNYNDFNIHQVLSFLDWFYKLLHDLLALLTILNILGLALGIVWSKPYP